MLYLGAALILAGLAIFLLPRNRQRENARPQKKYNADDGPLVVYLPQVAASTATSNVQAWSTSDTDEWRSFEAYKRAIKAGRVHYHHHVYQGAVTVHHEISVDNGRDGFLEDFGTPPKLPSGIKVGSKNQLLLEDKGGF